MYELFPEFLIKMKSRLRSIASATKNEITVDELSGDAWIVSEEIKLKRGRPIDFNDLADQELVIGALHVRNVKRPEKHFRYAERIDQTVEDEDGELNPWTNRLHADETTDPLVALLKRENELEREKLLAASYSQAAAYIAVFAKFKFDRKKICIYLVISEAALARRISAAIETVQRQPSLFDRIARIKKTFMPRPGKQFAVTPVVTNGGVQWGWEF